MLPSFITVVLLLLTTANARLDHSKQLRNNSVAPSTILSSGISLMSTARSSLFGEIQPAQTEQGQELRSESSDSLGSKRKTNMNTLTQTLSFFELPSTKLITPEKTSTSQPRISLGEKCGIHVNHCKPGGIVDVPLTSSD